MEIIIVSDNHGDMNVLSSIVSNFPDADAYIHCGDVEGSPQEIFPFVAVKGNNDYGNQFPLQNQVVVEGMKIVWLHSHTLGLNNRINQLERIMNDAKANMICYGHTHRIDIQYTMSGIILNPGSLSSNRDGNPLSFIRVSGHKESPRIDVIALANL